MKFLNHLLDNFEQANRQHQANLSRAMRERRSPFTVPHMAYEQAAQALALYLLSVRPYLALNLPDGVIDDAEEADTHLAKSILMFGQPCILACDARCNKAWGSSKRPRVYRTRTGDYTLRGGGDPPDPDDYAFLSDDELGIAPANPGTTEGDDPKPRTREARLNKWCARQCERSVIVDLNEPIELPDFSQRHYNIAPHTRKEPESHE